MSWLLDTDVHLLFHRCRAEQEILLAKAGRRMPVEDSYIAATARR